MILTKLAAKALCRSDEILARQDDVQRRDGRRGAPGYARAASGLDFKSRVLLADELKRLIATESHALHPKYCDALTLFPWWRVSLSINTNGGWGWKAAEALQEELCDMSEHARKLFSSKKGSFTGACGTFLARLAEKFPDQFKKKHSNSGNVWLVAVPK